MSGAIPRNIVEKIGEMLTSGKLCGRCQEGIYYHAMLGWVHLWSNLRACGDGYPGLLPFGAPPN